MGISFDLIKPEVDEVYDPNLREEEITNYLAQLKAEALSDSLNEKDILLTADTIVWHKGKAVEKPKNTLEAIEMLNSLSNSVHKVISSVCLRTTSKQVLFFDTTLVHFRELSRSEIEYYVKNYHPFDKAGGYGIQEWIGLIAVKKIDGSYFNVMGLPVHKLWEELQKL